ncbi:MAG TPA: FecR domain-containing protein [Caulobacteraceae bacterium]
MSEHETAEAINEQAMRFVAAIDRGGEGAVAAELEAWLAGDTRRQGAFLRAQAAWSALDRARLLPEEAPAPPAPSRRRIVAGGALAASLAAGGWLGWRQMRLVRIDTDRGEIRRVPLEDGSLAVVNTQSIVSADVTPEHRAVSVREGEAWFQVARDKQRPFIVAVGDVRIRAVGTAFSVRRMDRGAVVQVTEGEVETWCVSEPGRIVRLARGGRAYIAPNAAPAVAQKAEQEIDRSLGWRTGLIILQGDTLGEAAAEFNRYNDRQIRVEDAQLAAQTYVGRFRTNEPEAFVEAVKQTLGARVEVTPDQFVIYRE